MQILQNFGIQPVLLLAQIVNFLIILFLLKEFFYKPIVGALEDRKKTIAESLQNAQTIKENLTKTEESTAKILEEAGTSAQNIIDQAHQEAQRIADLAVAETRKLVQETQITAKAQIEAQRKDMREGLRQEILALVVEVVQKVLARTLTPRERLQLTSESILEIAHLSTRFDSARRARQEKQVQ